MIRTMTSIAWFAAIVLVAGAGAARAQDGTALTPKLLQAALDAKPTGAEAEQLAARIRTYFGGAEALAQGGAAKIDDLLVAFAIEAPAPAEPNAPGPRVSSDAVLFMMPLTRVGATNVYAGVAQLAHGTAFTWHYEVGDTAPGWRPARSVRDASRQPRTTRRAEGHGQADAAVGEQDLRGHEARLVGLRAGAVPAGEPAAVMVFQDGAGPEGLRADGVRQPDRRRRTCRSRSASSSSRERARTAAPTAASSTTRCPISTRGSCSRRSCRKSRRP